jgi:hypothetical protein
MELRHAIIIIACTAQTCISIADLCGAAVFRVLAVFLKLKEILNKESSDNRYRFAI